MIDLSVCIEMVYEDEPFEARAGRAADAGVDAVEFWDWRGKDLDALAAATDEAGIDIVGCTAGGVLTDPDATDDAIETIRESIRTAAEHGWPTLIVTTGPDQADLNRERQHVNAVKVLSRVASDAEEHDVTLALEPLNTAVDHPEYFLESSSEGFDIVDEVDSSHVKLLYDVYHQQITEGNIIQTLMGNVEKVGHVHVADVPGRHEPGTGELNYANIFTAIDNTDYDGYVGCEFTPTGDPDDAMAAAIDRL